VLCFNSGFVDFLNDFLLKLHMLTSFDIYGSCLEIHKPVIAAGGYDDATLLSQFLDSTDSLTTLTFSKLPLAPTFLGSPYDVCQRIEGARRFAVLHELGHHVFGTSLRNSHDATLRMYMGLQSSTASRWRDWNAYTLLMMSDQNVYGSKRRAEQAAEEFWCDVFAFSAIAEFYTDKMEERRFVYEAENAFVGMLNLFFMLDMIERGLGRYNDHEPEYPSAGERCDRLFEYMRGTKLFEIESFREAVARNASLLERAFDWLSGLAFAMKDGPIAATTYAYAPSSRITTEHGLNFYKNLREAYQDPIKSRFWRNLAMQSRQATVFGR
jgi:hypothetical protein